MFILGQTLILLGFALQIFNLIIDIRFILTRRANVTGSRKAGSFLDFLILGMVLLFCAVYLIIFFVKLQTVWVGILLFAGAVFVTTVLLWINTLTKEIRESAFSISETLIGIVEARDPNLNGHSLHVQELSLLIYNNLPAGFKRRINEENLKYAALFHDVGKLGVPEAILNKPTSLTPEEWNVMRRHPEISVQILRPLKSFDLIKEWILYHHERIDGSGYFGIPGDKIPFAARIISVADTYSAITMARSYKPGKSHEEAIEILQRVEGKQLDTYLVSLFCTIPKEDVLACMDRVKEKIRNQSSVSDMLEV